MRGHVLVPQGGVLPNDLHMGGEDAQNQAGRAMNSQLLIDPPQMRMYRVRGNAQLHRNSDFGFASHHALYHVQLPCRQEHSVIDSPPFFLGEPAGRSVNQRWKRADLRFEIRAKRYVAPSGIFAKLRWNGGCILLRCGVHGSCFGHRLQQAALTI